MKNKFMLMEQKIPLEVIPIVIVQYLQLRIIFLFAFPLYKL